MRPGAVEKSASGPHERTVALTLPRRVGNGAGEFRDYGLTGAITRLRKGKQERVAEGSHALTDGSTAGGPNDISFQGTAHIMLGLVGGHEFMEDLDSEFLGTLIQMLASGQVEGRLGRCSSRIRREPGRRSPGLESVRRARRAWRPSGHRHRCERVAGRSPDGVLYVGELTRFPFVQGLANIYRVVPCFTLTGASSQAAP